MQFCDDCGSMMRSENGRMVCTNDDCGREAAVDEERAAAFVSTEHQRNADVIEADPEADVEGRPTTTDVHCDECGTERAYYEIMQTASADEPPTRFFKCKDCGSVWRAYD